MTSAVTVGGGIFRFRCFLRIGGSLGILFGVGLLLVPELVLGINAAHTDATGIGMSRLFGAVLIEAGLTHVLISTASEPAICRRTLIAGMVGSVLGGAVAVQTQLQQLAGPQGWFNVAVYAFLLIGFALTLTRFGRPSRPVT